MNTLIKIDINLLALGLLSILYVSVLLHSDKHSLHVRLFLALIYLNAGLLVMDTVLWAIDGIISPMFYTILVVFNILYFALSPVVALIWLFYVDFHIFEDEDRLLNKLPYYLIPSGIVLVLVLTSLKTNYIFYITSGNVYVRGQGYLWVPILSLGTIVYTWILSYKHRKKVDSRALLGLQLFILPIIIGTLIQIVNYGTVLIWTSMTLSLLIIFISIEMRKIYRDYLTGAHSRRQLDEYLHYRIRLAKRSRGFTISMIDMDDFKYINDTFGHHIGDEALVKLVEILKDSIRRNDFIARYAGDEFVIIYDIDENEDLVQVENRIHENVKQFNASQPDSYQLKFSVGTETIKSYEVCDMDDLFNRIDMKMYEQKKRSKSNS